MISLEHVSARASWLPWARDKSVLLDVSLTWREGLLAIIGAPADGTRLLLTLLAGQAAPRHGKIDVRGARPTRARVALVARDVTLPRELSVREAALLARSARSAGEVLGKASALELLGLGHLAERRIGSLSRGETRALALAFALASTADLVVIEEPFVEMEPCASTDAQPGAPAIVSAIRSRAQRGPVIVVTASARDAALLADSVMVLSEGKLGPPAASPDGVGAPILDRSPRDATGAEIRLVVRPPGDEVSSDFVSALTADNGVAWVTASPFAAKAASLVVCGGPDLARAAAAVRAAVVQTGVEVDLLESFGDVSGDPNDANDAGDANDAEGDG